MDKKIKYRRTMAILVILFAVLGFLVNSTNIFHNIDKNIIIQFQRINSEALESIFKALDFLGSYNFYIPLSIVLLGIFIYKKMYYQYKLYLFSIAASTLGNKMIKLIYKRQRPEKYFLIDQGGFSFPSGHAMVTMTTYLAIAYILSKYFDKNEKLIFSIAIIYIFIMGISRVYLGVHWPTDIIGGYIAGMVVFLVGLNIDFNRDKIFK